jgi:ribosomal protein L17
MRTQAPLDVRLSHTHFLQLKTLYEEYCRRTTYSLLSPVAAFYPTMEKRSGGYTRCIGVEFQDGSKTTFSLDKALSAVATQT